jgi:hypothetical protein
VEDLLAQSAPGFALQTTVSPGGATLPESST